MSNSVDDLVNEIGEASRSGSLFETYVSKLATPISQLAQDVRNSPTEENMKDWLTVYARLAPLAIELPSDVTLSLFQRDEKTFQSAVSTLSPEDQEQIQELVKSSLDRDLTITDLQIPIPAAPVDVPVLGKFKIAGTFDGSRVRLYQGTLALIDRSGAELGSFSARTGGFVADFHTHNGPTPPGLYKVASFIPNPGVPGMTLHGIAFCFVLSPLPGTNVFGRSGLCIHPDEAPPGTHGCIGINEDADTLKQCSKSLANLLQAGQVGVSVEYASIAPVS
jgi:hypothetical protein